MCLVEGTRAGGCRFLDNKAGQAFDKAGPTMPIARVQRSLERTLSASASVARRAACVRHLFSAAALRLLMESIGSAFMR